MSIEGKVQAHRKPMPPSAWEFVAALRAAASQGVGYGLMLQLVEWEWQAKGLGAVGPEYYEGEIARLKHQLREQS